MTKLLLILMVVGLLSGCGPWYDDNPAGPIKGPEGQSLEEYYGKDSEGNRIMYGFYMSGPDTVKHGYYMVYHEGGPERFLSNLEKANDMVLKYHGHSRERAHLTKTIGKMISA